jgi:hypothetical protein|tara:strand:+ start:869 stop:1072 length:204 start_codon:yes stop_codon:yes gene_type:complete
MAHAAPYAASGMDIMLACPRAWRNASSNLVRPVDARPAANPTRSKNAQNKNGIGFGNPVLSAKSVWE